MLVSGAEPPKALKEHPPCAYPKVAAENAHGWSANKQHHLHNLDAGLRFRVRAHLSKFCLRGLNVEIHRGACAERCRLAICFS